MNERRISLTRLLAINWYGFRQILDVTNDTLISGAFGTGKSALLDLMQCVLLGEHWRPNRAASGNARGRTLVGYCLCDTNTLKEGEPHFTRTSGVTLVALEFSWPLEKGKTEPRRETWGLRIEYSSPTAEPKRTYFLIPERAEWATLAPGGRMLDEETFRTWIRRDFGRECLFARQQDYLAEMATPHHLYFDPVQFHKTFPKAIAFEPEENVEKFIRDFILEENPLDLRDVKAAVGAYRDTQARLEKQEDEAGYLRRIAEQHATFETSARTAAIYTHAEHALEHTRLSELVERHRNDLKLLDEKHAEDKATFDRSLKERATLEQQLKEFVLDADDAQLEQAQKDRRDVAGELTALREAQKTVRERLRNRAFSWANWLKQSKSLKLEGLKEFSVGDEQLLAALRGDNEPEALEALPQLANKFNDLFRHVESLLAPVSRQLEGDNTRLRQLVEDLDRLDRNETPGTFPLFNAIKAKLAASKSPPEQLCRLIEVKPTEEDWRNALELFLGRNRFAVMVAPADYKEALEVLKKSAPGREPESLVHPREAAELVGDIRKGSLAEKVEVTHKVAANYARHLLGNVMAVNRVEELDQCDRGVTRDGVFKQTPTRRRLRPTPGFEFTLGTEGIKRLKDAALREQKELMAARDARQGLIDGVRYWLDEGRKGGLGDPRLPDRSGELHRIPQLTARATELAAKIDFLSTDERKQRLKKRDQLQNDFATVNQKLGELGQSQQGYQQRHRELSEALATATDDLDATRLDLEESRTRLPAGIVDAELDKALKKLIADHPRWNERTAAARHNAEEAKLAAVNARNRRDAVRQELIHSERHPEYRHDFTVDEAGNDTWAARLRLLDETELPKFRALAAERRKDWEQRLKESVLDRLNERLNDAERTVKQLRQYLDREIGRFRYRISQKRDTAFGSLWKLLDSGFEPTDELLQASRHDEVQQALNQLMAAVEAADQADERAKRLLDYRHYHRYDLEMVLADRPDAPPISLGRSGRNLSGGENQAPFFISMLAAFHRVYDLGTARSQHLGLVVMDEAFSKLSGDGVEDCLNLARNFQLQLVLAFPPEKLGVMLPYADTIVVCQKLEQRDAAGYVTRIDNIPTLLTAEQVRESLE